jgi:hypothetical protein
MAGTAVTGRETASSADPGNSIGNLVQFTFLCSWRYRGQTRYVNIAFSRMHLLFNNRRKLVSHLLQELLVLRNVSAILQI